MSAASGHAYNPIAYRRIRNPLITDQHPHGLTNFVERQLRHLVRASADWLGAVGSSARAFHPKACDRWIAWSAELRHAVV